MKTKLKKYKNPYRVQWHDNNVSGLKEYMINFKAGSKVETIFLILNEFAEIPKCPYTNFPQKFNALKKEYYGWSKEIQEIVKDDCYIKNSSLTYLSILKLGVPYKKVLFYKLNKKFRKFIGKSNATPSSKFELERQFEDFTYLYGLKNKDRKYYSRRGITEKEISAILSKSADTYWSVKEKRKDPVYNEKYIRHRINASKKVGNRSRMEVLISEELRKEFKISTSKIINLGEEERVALKRNFLKPDIFLKDKNIIIEYNGRYWHKDFDYEKNKAEIVSAKLGCRYMVLWENDFEDERGYVNFIRDNLNSKEKIIQTTKEF